MKPNHLTLVMACKMWNMFLGNYFVLGHLQELTKYGMAPIVITKWISSKNGPLISDSLTNDLSSISTSLGISGVK